MEYEELLKNLNEKVSKISKSDTEVYKQLPAYDINKTAIYHSLVPLLTYIALYLIKPEFCMISEKGSNGEIYLDKKIRHKKLLIPTLIITIIVWISYFVFQYKKK